MAYCTQTDIEEMIPETTLIMLTDDEGDEEVNTARLTESIETADAEIDTYLNSVYVLPLAEPIPVILRKLSADISIYNLYSRTMEEIPDTRRDRYKDAIRLLEQINKGIIDLGVPATDDIVPLSTVRFYAV